MDETTGRGDAPILLVTKLHPPLVPVQAVARERLFARLDEGRGKRLTLVACPAGFGKSTLVASWGRQDDRPLSWVTLDEGDDDPVVLWSHVVAALAVGLDALVLSAPLREVVLPRLVNALAEQPERVLVLDDFHRLCGEAARESVAWFIDHAPATLQLVLSTRVDPELPLATLRARAQLLELRADELRFTVPEAHEFLQDRLALRLDPGDVELLTARTEGWPAGIYLAALSLAGADDKHERVLAFDGTSAHIADYLVAEVLAAHPPELQAFMLRTAVLERLCAPLCDALLDASVSAAALASLARTNLFLLPLDDRGEWFRFHHLFAQILRSRLEPELVQSLHRRAFAWHRAYGTADEAIHHALAAGAFAGAGELVCEAWVHYANSGRTASVAEWLRRLPDADDARLLLVRAWVAALQGDESGMRAAVARVQALGGPDDGPLPDGFASVESSMSVLFATFGWGDVPAILTHGARSAALEGPGSPWRPVITWALGWAHYCNDDLDEAEHWLTETIELAPRFDQWIVGVAAMADLSLIAGLRGDRDAQLRLAEEAVAATRRAGLLDAREDGEVHTAYGLALAADGHREQAIASLEKGIFLRRLWGQQLDLVDGLLALASVDRSRAASLLDEADALLAACPDPGALPERLRALRPDNELSERELAVLRELAAGRSEREIGAVLFISFNTVHSHVKAIYRKLGASSRADALARARERGAIP